MQMHYVKPMYSTLAGGLTMWITAGLWHNLILPSVNANVHAHHEGLFIGLIAYLVLSLIIVIIYPIIWPNEKNEITKGLKIGIFIGIVWVLPHGLALAGVHHTSIIYEFKNTLYHVFEQSIGAIVIALLLRSKQE